MPLQKLAWTHTKYCGSKTSRMNLIIGGILPNLFKDPWIKKEENLLSRPPIFVIARSLRAETGAFPIAVEEERGPSADSLRFHSGRSRINIVEGEAISKIAQSLN